MSRCRLSTWIKALTDWLIDRVQLLWSGLCRQATARATRLVLTTMQTIWILRWQCSCDQWPVFWLATEVHVLHPLLPDTTNYSYNLRSRHHNRQLIRNTSLRMLIIQISSLECNTLTHINCYLLSLTTKLKGHPFEFQAYFKISLRPELNWRLG